MASNECTPLKRPSLSLQHEDLHQGDATIFSPGIVTPGHTIQSLFKDISNNTEERPGASRLGSKQLDSPSQEAEKAKGAVSASPATVPKRGCLNLLTGRTKAK
eukprot:CAMPEP_0206141318 /NCGR_PEP_ID=MMETSP1473-20131121/12530_1 /ASSEMBLY_ACC=CAM_ASM_001109 /TAXON_ID=1461547 /ORGANISM="Stichococcus sp, Strain RCC1054" /LENGTH=102 /DNA_ID=CAMNT_0053535835 /DNA_START=187 /DNA_END=498 /DNA_ORIENTATION=-